MSEYVLDELNQASEAWRRERWPEIQDASIKIGLGKGELDPEPETLRWYRRWCGDWIRAGFAEAKETHGLVLAYLDGSRYEPRLYLNALAEIQSIHIVRLDTILALLWQDEDLVSPSEAARLNGLGPERIRQLCKAGVMPGALKRGRHWRIPRSSITGRNHR